MSFNLRNRIAFFYLTAAAAVTLLLFFVIYQVVYSTAYGSLDDRLEFEASDVLDDIDSSKDVIVFTDTTEWTEAEHQNVEVYPVFIEVLSLGGNVIKKTPNLRNATLPFTNTPKYLDNFNSELAEKKIRQTQKLIVNHFGKPIGFLLIAIPLEGTEGVILNLRKVLLISFPAVLIVLFFLTRAIAGKSIAPLVKVTKEAETITKDDLAKRIEHPKNKDEILKLAQTVNGLLDRLEDAVLREKQFTADASHELRTPLAIIKGTLEVLVRKPRDLEHYKNKITDCIREVNRINGLIDQLLLLARAESAVLKPNSQDISLNDNIKYCIDRLKSFADEKKISIIFPESDPVCVNADSSMIDIIFENLLSNSIKYSFQNSEIKISVIRSSDKTELIIEDCGIGMTGEQVSRVFDRFYRSEEARSSQIGGHGIGLAIVKRLVDAQNLFIKFESIPQKGTKVILTFPS